MMPSGQERSAGSSTSATQETLLIIDSECPAANTARQWSRQADFEEKTRVRMHHLDRRPTHMPRTRYSISPEAGLVSCDHRLRQVPMSAIAVNGGSRSRGLAAAAALRTHRVLAPAAATIAA